MFYRDYFPSSNVCLTSMPYLLGVMSPSFDIHESHYDLLSWMLESHRRLLKHYKTWQGKLDSRTGKTFSVICFNLKRVILTHMEDSLWFREASNSGGGHKEDQVLEVLIGGWRIHHDNVQQCLIPLLLQQELFAVRFGISFYTVLQLGQIVSKLITHSARHPWTRFPTETSSKGHKPKQATHTCLTQNSTQNENMVPCLSQKRVSVHCFRRKLRRLLRSWTLKDQTRKERHLSIPRVNTIWSR